MRPPRATPTDTRFPHKTLFRSHGALARCGGRRLDDGMAAAADVEAGLVGKVGTAPIMAHRMVGERRGDVDACEYVARRGDRLAATDRSEEHTSELQSLMRISYAVFCLKKKKNKSTPHTSSQIDKTYS